MSNLLASLVNSTGSLQTYGRALEVISNNVSNASTPGYAKQVLQLEALPFSSIGGSSGGVSPGKVVSTRDEYVEQSVRQALIRQGETSQLVSSLTSLEAALNISSGSGISSALSNLYDAFSEWSVNPDSTVSRQNVLDKADLVATAFRETAKAVMNVRSTTESRLQDAVDNLNQLARTLADLNARVQAGNQDDSSLDAKIHNTLDEMASLADITALRQEDGSYTVLLSDQTLLVNGDDTYPFSVAYEQPTDPTPTYAEGSPPAVIRSASGTDITSQITGGALGALLEVRNEIIPGILGDAYQVGSLNELAISVASRINSILASGNISDTEPVQAGGALFSYSLTNDTVAAYTMKLDPAATTSTLAAIDPGPPEVSNGIPLRLAELANPTDSEDRIGGYSFTQYYGRIAAAAGSALQTATSENEYAADAVTQAESIREDVSGVSLDEEAALLIEFQRAYQATAKLITVLDELTQTIINIL